jgi:hypothetical protein
MIIGLTMPKAKTKTTTLNAKWAGVLWTGNGYHIYQPVSGFILEEYETFYEFTKYVDKDLTSMFIQFAEEHFRQLVKLSCRISLFPNIVKNWLQTPLL